ncbi:MAG: CoA pyrophosphatase [Pseudomonadota bacterium]
MAEYLIDDALKTQIAANLAAHPLQQIEDGNARAASVCVVVTSHPDGGAAILLTLRPSKMGRHAGQYALPGGKVDPGETDEQAARRELFEELGLKLGPGAIIGCLDDYATRSGFRIRPFVLWAGSNVTLIPNPDEVERVLYIPFSELDSDAIPHFEDGETPERPVLYSRFPTIGHSMYSPTAAMIYQFREIALHGRPTRVVHFDQPRFAWR